MTSLRFCVLSALTLSLVACHSLPSDGQSALLLAEPNVAMLGGYAIQATDTKTLSTDIAPSIASMGWQEFYYDDKLKALIALGLANNKNLQSAALAVQSAIAQHQITHIGALPTPDVGVGYQRSLALGDSRSSQGYVARLGLSNYEIDFWGRVANKKEEALQNFLATQADQDTVQIALIAQIANAYVSISYALAQLQLAESTVSSRENSLFIAERRFLAGVDSKIPALQAKSSLESARLAVVNAKTNLAKAQNSMELLLGSPMPSELVPEPALTGIILPEILNAGLPSELLYHRPDIISAEHKLQAAGANIAVARAGFFPSVSLTGNIGFGAGRLADLFDNNTWSFGPNISLPIFDHMARQANYEVAKIAQQQALTNYERVIQTAFKEVKDVLADRATIDERLIYQYRMQDNFQESYMLAYETYRAGLSGYLEVLDVERALFDSQQSILETERQKVLSQIELYKVLGGGITPMRVPTVRLASADEVEAGQTERSPKVITVNDVHHETADMAKKVDINTNDATQIDNKDDNPPADYLPIIDNVGDRYDD